jgi:protein-S-isoprenylcysteine O-methyltransferase Ste14/pimeloyl-ACP methyl ester carboxylesterase
MTSATRSVLAVLALPGVVALLVPLLIARGAIGAEGFRWPALALLLPGIGLLAWCVREFQVRGQGTLAPWDPPRHLVATGLYGLSRNPMYVAVTLILLGWALGYSSWVLLVYAMAVAAAFHVRVVVNEEPFLARTHRDAWTTYSARVPRWVFRSRMAVLWFWIAVAVLTPVGALLSEAYVDTRAMEAFPPPGQLVDIGGRRLHLLCLGSGAPIVFFESGVWSSSVSFEAARDRIAARTMVCSYDRRGSGWSDPVSGAASVEDLARDLAVLQDRAKLPAPFVVVATSVGGLTSEFFARQFPERVAGLVMLDAANSLVLPSMPALARWLTPAACGAAGLAYLGVIRFADPFGLNGDPSEEARRSAALAYNARTWSGLCAIARGRAATMQAFAGAPPLPADLPLSVLSASSTENLAPPGADRVIDVEAAKTALVESHQRLATMSSRGTWRMVPDSTHLIAASQPDAVVDAVVEILSVARR